jgi:hypothetical protein
VTMTDVSADPQGFDCGDGCSDLVVGAPGANGGRDAVLVACGSDTGIEPTGGIRVTGRTAGERFGAAIAAERKDIRIAAPTEPCPVTRRPAPSITTALMPAAPV